MKTFSLNNYDSKFHQKLMEAVNNNIPYFKKFNGSNWEEAAQKVFVVASYNENYDDLEPYVKKLARTVMRVRSRENPYDMYNENGEVSYVFSKLVDSFDEESLDGVDEIYGKFKELYLLDKSEFMKLASLFEFDNKEDIKKFAIKNQVFRDEFSFLVGKYGANTVFQLLYKFFKDLMQLVRRKNEESIRKIVLKKGDLRFIDRIPDSHCIASKGVSYGIDKSTLEMSVNPDYINWDTTFNTNCDILKIDISPIINLMYEEVFVEQGVSTKHITWCGDKYKLTSPGGVDIICGDKDNFISFVRVELILNMLMNNLNTVIAVSPDSVYIKPTRAIHLDRIRVKFVNGKVIDLPVNVHIKKVRYSN